MKQRLKMRLLAIGLLAFGLSATYFGTRMLVAAIGYHQAGLFIADWEQHGRVPDTLAAQVATKASLRALQWAPVKNGRYYERHALVLRWQHHAHVFGDPAVRALRDETISAYRAATVLRPTWPDAWLGLAYAKLSQLQLDEEFQHALQRASTLGPWRAHILAGVAEVGLLAWPSLDEPLRAEVLDSVERAVSLSAWSRNKVRQAAVHAGALTMICLHGSIAEQLECVERPG